MNAVLPDTTKNVKHLASFRFLMITRILSGYYNAFFPQKSIRIIAGLYCVVLYVAISKILFDLSVTFFLNTIVNLTHWLVNVLVSIITREHYFFRFCTAIRQTDLKMGKPYLSLNQPASRIIWIAINLINVGIFIILTSYLIFGYINYHDWLGFFAFAILRAALNVNNIIHLYIFEIASHRVKVLRSALERSLKKSSRRGHDNVTHKIRYVKEAVSIYKRIYEYLNLTFAPMKVLIFTSLCFNFFKVVLNSLQMVYHLRTHQWRFTFIISAVENFVACIMACLPAVFAEQVASEVNKIKIVLADQLLTCEDKQLRGVVEDFLEYMTARPLKITICRAWSVDMTMPISFIGLCTTYIMLVTGM